MLVLAQVEGGEASIGGTGRHHRDLALEGHEPFEDERRAAELGENRVPVALFGGADDALAFAVIAEAAGLQHGGKAYRLQRAGEVVRRIDLPERRGGDAEAVDEALLGQPVLSRGEGVGAGAEGRVARQQVGGLPRDVLELVGHDVDARREAGEGV